MYYSKKLSRPRKFFKGKTIKIVARGVILFSASALVLFQLGCSGFTLEWRIRNDDPTTCVAGVTGERRSYVPSTITLPLQEIARIKLPSAVSQNLCANRDFLLVPTLDGRLSAIDLKLLRIIHKKKLSNGHAATIAVWRQSLFIAMRFGKETLLHYDLLDGHKYWEIDAGDIDSEPLVSDSLVFVAALYKHIDAYRLQNGTRRWQFQTEAQLHASPALSQGILVAAGDDGKVYGLEAFSGRKLWEFNCNVPVLATPAIYQNRVFVGTARDSAFALNLQDGTLLWKHYIGAKVMHAPAVNDSMVIFGSSKGTVHALNVKDGSPRWSFRAGSVIGTSPLLTNNLVFFGSLDRFLYGLDARSGEVLWKHELDGRIRTNPILAGDHLIVASEDRFVYIFGKPVETATN